MTAGPEPLKVLSQKRIADRHFIIELESPRIARSAKPGQFVQVRLDESSDPLLPRPFSFLDASKKSFRILYQVVGKGTLLMSEKKPGDRLLVLGPLGNGFSWRPKTKDQRQKTSLVLVGGGVGIPPLYHLAKTVLEDKKSGFEKHNIHVFLGARNKTLLHCESDFRKLGAILHLATDDGTKGHRGLVTEILDDHLNAANRQPPTANRVVYTCGPTAMLKAVSVLSLKYGCACQASVEEPMACGFGACIGCAIKVKDGSGFRYAMACCEGPVFDGTEIIWD